jgi:hypothetical protein
MKNILLLLYGNEKRNESKEKLRIRAKYSNGTPQSLRSEQAEPCRETGPSSYLNSGVEEPSRPRRVAYSLSGTRLSASSMVRIWRCLFLMISLQTDRALSVLLISERLYCSIYLFLPCPNIWAVGVSARMTFYGSFSWLPGGGGKPGPMGVPL